MRRQSEFVVECACGKVNVTYLGSRDSAIREFRKAGWRTMRTGLFDICPSCVAREKESGS
jgi:hypothetical protein